MKVYIIICDWKFQDNSYLDIMIFDSYKKAFDYFNETVNDNKANHPWLSDIFEEHKIPPKKAYMFNTCIPTDTSKEKECFWRLSDKNYEGDYFFIDLNIKEVQ